MTAATSIFSLATDAAAGIAARGEFADAKPVELVGQLLVPATDEEREAEIKRLGTVIVERYKVWAMEGCFAARGDADRASAQQTALIRGRSPGQVLKMERERGLL